MVKEIPSATELPRTLHTAERQPKKMDNPYRKHRYQCGRSAALPTPDQRGFGKRGVEGVRGESEIIGANLTQTTPGYSKATVREEEYARDQEEYAPSSRTACLATTRIRTCYPRL